MGRGQVSVVNLCEAEVGQLDDHVGTMILEQKVLGFTISVCNVVVVAVLQRLGNLGVVHG